jgi:hypothetical protein
MFGINIQLLDVYAVEYVGMVITRTVKTFLIAIEFFIALKKIIPKNLSSVYH